MPIVRMELHGPALDARIENLLERDHSLRSQCFAENDLVSHLLLGRGKPPEICDETAEHRQKVRFVIFHIFKQNISKYCCEVC